MVFQLLREKSADMGRHAGILQQEGALEKFAAVKSAPKNEVPVQQRAGFLEKVEDFVH